MTIDISKIKPGDTVTVRYQTRSMQEAGVAPVEVKTEAYQIHHHEPIVMGWALPSEHVTVLSHTPKEPDWADALVVRDLDNELWARVGARDWFRIAGTTGRLRDREWLAEHGRPITVVIDADGQVVT